ncbi:MAG: InlB B-repeat-containing protein [Bacilli bacterium]|nr:InlB B-repeat-containing protein [Bacilli bacterium]
MKNVKKILFIVFISILFIPNVMAASKYTIKFDANKGEGKTSKVSCVVNKKCKLTANAFKRDGYTFVGWNTKKNGTGITYTNKQKVKNLIEKGTIKLYAMWKANTYTIKFNGNGETAKSMKKLKATYGKKIELTKNKYKKDGYTFIGWNTKKNGTGKTYKNNASVKNLVKKGTITLYAIWVKNTYTVKFDGNGSASEKMKNITCKANKKCELTANTYKKEGYVFSGWNTKSDGTGVTYKNKASVKNITSKASIKLYAIFKPITYYLKLVDFETNNSKTINCTYDKKCKITSNDLLKDNYTIVGYETSLNNADKNYKLYKANVSLLNLTSKKNQTITLYAKYRDNKSIELENKVKEIITNNIKNGMTNVEKIKTIHNYIIKNSEFDSAKVLSTSGYDSSTAYGVLIQGYGLSEGYADAMKQFLDKFKLKNYVITVDDHSWNYVYVDNKYLHIDVTLDDNSKDGKIPSYDYFLVNDESLNSENNKIHEIGENISYLDYVLSK